MSLMREGSREHEQREEVLYDLTWNLAKSNIQFDDSRVRYQTLQSWVDDFQCRHVNTDWTEVDYILAVDTFYTEMVELLK